MKKFKITKTKIDNERYIDIQRNIPGEPIIRIEEQTVAAIIYIMFKYGFNYLEEWLKSEGILEDE